MRAWVWRDHADDGDVAADVLVADRQDVERYLHPAIGVGDGVGLVEIARAAVGENHDGLGGYLAEPIRETFERATQERVGIGRRRRRLGGTRWLGGKHGTGRASRNGRRIRFPPETVVHGGEAAPEAECTDLGPGAGVKRLVNVADRFQHLVPAGWSLADRHALRTIQEVEHFRALHRPRSFVNPDGIEHDQGEDCQDRQSNDQQSDTAGRRDRTPRRPAPQRENRHGPQGQRQDQADGIGCCPMNARLHVHGCHTLGRVLCEHRRGPVARIGARRAPYALACNATVRRSYGEVEGPSPYARNRAVVTRPFPESRHFTCLSPLRRAPGNSVRPAL